MYVLVRLKEVKMKSLKKVMLMGLLAVMTIPTLSSAASFSGNVGGYYTNV